MWYNKLCFHAAVGRLRKEIIMTVSILKQDASLAYAAGEVARFLNQYTTTTILPGEGGERTVTLLVDPSLPAHHST